MIFVNAQKQKEWDELCEENREFVMKNLASVAERMECKAAIDEVMSDEWKVC